MKRFLIVSFAVLLILIGIFLLVRFIVVASKGKGALQVTANIESSVFLNNALIGKTPLCKCKQDLIKEEEYTLKIEPEDPTYVAFTTKVKIGKDVLTAVDRTFLPGSLASASVLTLEKNSNSQAGLLVMSIPESGIVTIDGNSEGLTPFEDENISASEHEVEIQKNGFNKKTLRIRTVPSYKLIAQVILGTEVEQNKQSSQNEPAASPSAQVSLTPTPKTTKAKGTIIRIKDTPTGFLRVRSGPSTSEKEVARVNPDEEYEYVDEQNGWYQIKLEDSNKGWVSASYSEKITNP